MVQREELIMNSKRTLEKYIDYTFDRSVKVNYSSSITAEITLKDGVIKLLALNDMITVYIGDKEYQTLQLVGDYFYVRKIN